MMENGSFHFFPDKFVLRVRNRVCNTSEELISSEPFEAFYHAYLGSLKRHDSSAGDLTRLAQMTGQPGIFRNRAIQAECFVAIPRLILEYISGKEKQPESAQPTA